jgi:hypothetical protein
MRKWSAFWTEDLKDRESLAPGNSGRVCWGDVFECFSVHTGLFLEAGCAKWVVSAREGQEVSLSAGNTTQVSCCRCLIELSCREKKTLLDSPRIPGSLSSCGWACPRPVLCACVPQRQLPRKNARTSGLKHRSGAAKVSLSGKETTQGCRSFPSSD